MNYKAFDIGYGYLKYPDENGVIQKAKAVIGELGESMNDPEGCDIFTFNNVRYVVGDDVYKLGKKPMTANENEGRPKNIVYKILGLYALAKMGVKESFGIVTGLPHQLLEDESELVKEVFMGSHKINLDGVDIELNITDVKVASQGYGTFYELLRQRSEEVLKKKILVVDIGFRTIVYIPVFFGNIDVKKVRTSKQMGIQRSYNAMIEEANREYKKNYKFYRMDEFLDKGLPLQDETNGKEREAIKNKSYVFDGFAEYAKDIWEDIRDKYDDDTLDELDDIVFAGGSAERVGEYLLEHAKQYCSFMDDSQDAQVKGYGIIAEKLSAKALK